MTILRPLLLLTNLHLKLLSTQGTGADKLLSTQRVKTYCSNLYCAPMWFDCTKTVLTKLKVAYNNSLRRFMGLPWHNSASEMFVNLNIKSFGELLRVFVHVFRSRITVSRNFML